MGTRQAQPGKSMGAEREQRLGPNGEGVCSQAIGAGNVPGVLSPTPCLSSHLRDLPLSHQPTPGVNGGSQNLASISRLGKQDRELFTYKSKSISNIRKVLFLKIIVIE